MRLIDADKLNISKYTASEASHNDMGGAYRQGWNDAIDAIAKNCPTVDAVEVVRCNDCKHKVTTEDGEYDPEDIVCNYWMSDGLTEKDFCSYGERKDNEINRRRRTKESTERAFFRRRR